MDLSDPVVLYVEVYWHSPWDFACWVALREKGVPFGTATGYLSQEIGVPQPLRTQTFAARIPALQHGDLWLSESFAITEYVDEVFPPPRHARLLPADPGERGRARQLSILARIDWDALRDERPSRNIFYPAVARAPAPLGARAARQAAELVDAVEFLLRRGQPFLFGEFTITDADVAFALMRLITAGDPVPEAVRAYAARIWARPSIHEFASHARPPHPPNW